MFPSYRCIELDRPKDMKQERQEITRLLKHWMTVFRLGHFTLYWRLVPSMEDDDPDLDSYTWASVSVNHQNLTIHIRVSRAFFQRRTSSGTLSLPIILGHELYHAVLSEVFDPLMEELQLVMAAAGVQEEIRGLFAKRWNEAHERAARLMEPALERIAS